MGLLLATLRLIRWLWSTHWVVNPLDEDLGISLAHTLSDRDPRDV
ncbi:hypothetical protein Svir_31880 [Saccharomonospora viridis DSM 43017]|uniref:Uncharacterized protein n=1 Tax=Saccharomonospora viridis (strain ATCC 15386 / DSM 43017 / JCM 3036 / CCUG 5913 / NBRC 12207 / NCIMB 9602 / P101) TaxID=471857 RepID=C7MYS2_SACVD|nr:hypothetical protein Svir_31880 [Saccharomonospora viridis DSM 43017]